MIKTKGVVHFSLPVSDIERSLAFYTDVLGMEVSEKRDIMVFLRTGDDHFMLTQGEGPGVPDADPGAHPQDALLCHHAFWVEADKYDEYVQHLRDKGVDVVFEENRPPPANFAGRRAYFRDPDGHVLEIIDWENPTK